MYICISLLTCLPISATSCLSDTEFRVGCWIRCFRSGYTGLCNCSTPACTPSHDLSCRLAQVARTKKHYAITHIFGRAFELSGADVEWEPTGINHQIDDRINDLNDSPTRPQRGDFSSTGGATLGAAKAVMDISVVSCFHANRVESLLNALENRHQAKLNHYRPVFGNFYPIVISSISTYHHSVTAIFQALKSHGVNIPALKADIAFTLLKFRVSAYTAMFDISRPPSNEVDYSMSERPRSSAHRVCAFSTMDFGPSSSQSTRHTRRSGPV
jgi:hypothetical protein